MNNLKDLIAMNGGRFHNFDVGVSPHNAIRLNPVGEIVENTDFVMAMLIQMANVPISEEQKGLATRIALDQAAAGGEVTLLSLVDAWDQVPELSEFSDVLRKATMPGSYGRMFVNPIKDTIA